MITNFTRERVSRFNLATYLHYAQGWTMRVWREPSGNDPQFYEPGRTAVDNDVANTISKFVEHVSNPLEVAKAVLELPRVTEVEVTDLTGFGEHVRKVEPEAPGARFIPAQKP